MKRWLLVCLPLLALLAGMTLPSSGKLSLPTQIHLSWQETSNQMVTVTWATEARVLNPMVEFGADPSYSMSRRPAKTFLFPIAQGTHFHSVQMGPLTPGQIYRYRVGDPVGGWSKVYRFAHPAP